MKKLFESETSYRGKGKLVYGFGLNDVSEKTISQGKRDHIYMKWKGMLYRVYSKRAIDRRASYAETEVCQEWSRFSSFKSWFLNQIGCDMDYEVDKDLLYKGNNLYSPDTCILVPSEINKFLIGRNSKKDDLPVGVHKHVSGKYKAQINEGGKRVCLITTDNIEDAKNAYIKRKEYQANKLALKYKDLVDYRVYEALTNYKA